MGSKNKLLFAFLFFIAICNTNSWSQSPGNASTNLNLWLKANASGTHITKIPFPPGNFASIEEWSSEQDTNIVFDHFPNIYGPLFPLTNYLRNLGTYEGAYFYKDTQSTFLQTTQTIIPQGSHNEITIYIVSSVNKLFTTTNNPQFSTKNFVGNPFRLDVNIPDKYGNINWRHGNTPDTLSVPYGNTVLNRPYLWTFTFNSTTQRDSIKRNGALLGQSTFTNTVNNTIPFQAYIGAIGTDSSSFNLGEIAVYGNTTSADQKRRVESYLGLKYGITLRKDSIAGSTHYDAPVDYVASNSATIWDNTKAGKYIYNVAGVGIDSSSGLIQRQNRSVNQENYGDMLRMAWGNWCNSNELNPYSPGKDKDRVFYIWSDNADSISLSNSTDLPNRITDSFCASKILRNWKIQRSLADTNAISSRTMQVVFNLKHMDTTKHSFQLLVDQDGDGNFKTGNLTIYPASVKNDSLLYFNNVKWDADKNGIDAFTIMMDGDKAKPFVTTKDTLWAVIGDSVSFYDMLANPDTAHVQYNFFDASNNSLVYSSNTPAKFIRSNGIYNVGGMNRITDCNSQLNEKVVVIFRNILKTWMRAVDASGNSYVEPKDTIKYSLLIINADTVGRQLISNLSIKDGIPAHTSYVSGSGGVLNGNEVTFSYSGLNLNYGDTLKPYPTFRVKADSAMDGIKTISNMGIVTINKHDFHSGGNVNDPQSIPGNGDSMIIYTIFATSDVGINKTILDKDSLYIGNHADFRIALYNLGPNVAENIIVRDTIQANLDVPQNIIVPVGTTNFNSVTRELTWTVPQLAAGLTENLDFSCTILSGTTVGNSANVTSNTPDTGKINNHSNITASIIKHGVFDGGIPNVITPNNDGKNDFFYIKGLDAYPNSELQIFNRWGNAIFSSSNYKNNWAGEGLAEGTYYYVLKVNNATKDVYKGWVEIIRSKD